MEFQTNQYQVTANLLPSTQDKVGEFRQELSRRFEGAERTAVEEALLLMCEIHADQEERPDGAPYVEHPLEVAQMALKVSTQPNHEVVIAALLHDSIEDQAAQLANKLEDSRDALDETSQALRYIENRFGSRVAQMLSALNNPDFVGGPSPKWFIASEENVQRLYAHILEAVRDPDLLLLKLLDFTTNGLRLDLIADQERKARLTKKYAPVARLFIRELASNRPLDITANFREQVLDQLWEEYSKMLGMLATTQG